MSKQITMSMWCSVIPTKMYNRWVKRGWIEKGALSFACGEKGIKGHYNYALEKEDLTKYINSKSQVKRLKTQGFKESHKTWVLSKLRYDKMSEEVTKWYDKVFKYIKNWLFEEGYAKIKQGTFDGGFCVEEDPEKDVVKNWCAPLADEGNKVTQIKEKFGRIVVYFNSLSKVENDKIDKFAKRVEKKFDCLADFC